jgi:hypothetical protein
MNMPTIAWSGGSYYIEISEVRLFWPGLTAAALVLCGITIWLIIASRRRPWHRFPLGTLFAVVLAAAILSAGGRFGMAGHSTGNAAGLPAAQ